MTDTVYVVSSDDLDMPGVEVTSDSFEDAATEAMEAWESGGSFAGENLHGDYTLQVIEKKTLKSANVKVNVDYEITFTAYEAEVLEI